MDDITTETGTQLLLRLAKRSPLTGLLPSSLLPEESSLAPGHVLEITGEPGAGKTELLMHFIVQCLLPHAWNGVELRGNGCGVLLVDTDHHFDLLRLAIVLEASARQRLVSHQNKLAADIGTLVCDCLLRLLIVPCYSSNQLLITLPSLASVLSAHRGISLLIIDSLSAFYWPDRMSASDPSSFVYPCRRAVSTALQSLTMDFGLVIIATRQQLIQPRKASDGWKDVEYLEKEWQKLVKSRVRLQAATVSSGKTEVKCVCSCKNWRQEKKFTIATAGIEWK